MATTADIKNGVCIKHNDKLFQIIEFQHVKPGKGPAFVRTKMRQIETGKVIDNTFSAGHKIEIVRIENREYQYLYQEGSDFIFMNNETFEQVNIPGKMIDKPIILFTTFWDANRLIKDSFFLHRKDQNTYYRIFIDATKEEPNFIVKSVALGIPKENKIPNIKNIERLSFFCPTYDILSTYKNNNDWCEFEARYKDKLRKDSSAIKSWILVILSVKLSFMKEDRYSFCFTGLYPGSLKLGS
jgi:translation elongation factor P/translation initiation factor 5A